jgi:N-acetylneuraminate synthase
VTSNVLDEVVIGGRRVGVGQPAYVVAEIGINHNGDLAVCKSLIDTAVAAGCDAVKFQKRTPELCVPEDQRSRRRETPWGEMSYLEYKHRIEFGEREYAEIDAHCQSKNIQWFASCWDEPSVDFMQKFKAVAYKIASASLTDSALLRYTRRCGVPIILSTGMSSADEIDEAVRVLGREQLLICHATSSYPCPPEQLNLRMIHTLRERYGVPIGYSGHETGLQTTLAAVTLGACMVERHITLDRAMWGTDHAASVEPPGLLRLVRDIRVIEKSLGDGVKRVYDSELAMRDKLRRR